MKRCPRCRRELPLALFATDRSKKSGRKAHCKACDRQRAAAYYARNASKIRPIARERERRRRAGGSA